MDIIKRLCFILALCLLMEVALSAQIAGQSGVIRGVVTDNEGNPIPGMTVVARSTALLGTISDITSIEGSFRLPSLPPGIYTITAELEGFKTVRQEGISVQVGQIVFLTLRSEPSALKEEIVVTAPSPTVDIQSTKIDATITSTMMQRLPLNRNLVNLLILVAGSAGTIDTYQGVISSINGGGANTISYEFDGVSNNDPASNVMFQAPQFDSVEEIEITTGGLSAQIGNTGGAFVNVITKSGGNEFHGQFQAYYTNKHLNEVLFSNEQLDSLKIGKPSYPIYEYDISGILGGPIAKDKLWFFATLSSKGSETPSIFIPTVINGKKYEQYKDPQSTWQGFLKLTTQLSPKLRLFGMVAGMLFNRDVYPGGGARATYESTLTQKKNTWVTATGNLNWVLSANTFIDFRAGHTNRWYPLLQRPESAYDIAYVDLYTGYNWGGLNQGEAHITRRIYEGSAHLAHFLDDFLGGEHELGVGAEYKWGEDSWGTGRKNPINWNLWNGNIYYYRGYYQLNGPHPVLGDGLLSFANMGPNRGDTVRDLPETRFAGYLMDSWTLKNRLTINIGARFDYYRGWARHSQIYRS